MIFLHGGERNGMRQISLKPVFSYEYIPRACVKKQISKFPSARESNDVQCSSFNENRNVTMCLEHRINILQMALYACCFRA